MANVSMAKVANTLRSDAGIVAQWFIIITMLLIGAYILFKYILKR